MPLYSLVVLGLVLLPALALGEGFRAPDDGSGTDLLYYCRAALKVAEDKPLPPQATVNASYCGGRIVGMLELYRLATGMGWMTAQVCVPDGVSVDQVIRVVVQYLQMHPAMLHERGVKLTVLAFQEAFPCTPGTVSESH